MTAEERAEKRAELSKEFAYWRARWDGIFYDAVPALDLVSASLQHDYDTLWETVSNRGWYWNRRKDVQTLHALIRQRETLNVVKKSLNRELKTINDRLEEILNRITLGQDTEVVA